MMIINPSRRKRTARKSRTRRAARTGRRARMTRRKNPIGEEIVVMAANPRKRKTRKKSYSRTRRRSYRRNPASNPRRRTYRRRRYRRNPRGLGNTRMKLAGVDLTKAALGSVGFIGSIAATKAMGIQGGLRYVVPAGVGIAAKMVGARFIGSSNANALMMGAVMASAVIAVNDFLIPSEYRIPALMSGVGQDEYDSPDMLTAEDILTGTGQSYERKQLTGLGQTYVETSGIGESSVYDEHERR